MKRITLYILICCGLIACKKDTAPAPDVIYTVSLTDYTATFTNQTKDAKSYEWDFGDGTSSTEESPVHTYPGKGKFVPTLHITTNGGVKAEGSTVIHIAKSSPVKLDDHSLSDWDTITQNVIVAGPGGGNFKKAKFDYNSDNVYFYIEMQATEADGDIFDFYLDADGNTGTGYLTGTFPGAGYDVLMEGTVLGGWLDTYYFTGGASQNGWSWGGVTIADFYQVGTVVQDGNILKIEGSFSRSKIKGLTGKGLRLAFTISNNGWSTIGFMPDEGAQAFSMDMSE